MTVFENDREAVVQIKRSGSLKSVISGYVTTVDGTAIGIVCDIPYSRKFSEVNISEITMKNIFWKLNFGILSYVP